ncbi:MAG: hypothetical protein HUU11_16865 [Anaerolineales bacterium]|nr:hypothetical protein [Anaerolineales bacterium]
MSFDNQLIHTCTIKPAAAGSVNVYNNAAKAFGTPVTGVRCRLVESRERVWSTERQEGVIQSVYKLFTKADVSSLTEKAEISLVTLEDGTTLSDIFRVTELFVRRGRNSHHKMATLERIS